MQQTSKHLNNPAAIRACMHSYSHTCRFTAASLNPDRAGQGSYTLITLARAWNRRPCPHTNTLSDSLSHRCTLTQPREIHSAVTQHLILMKTGRSTWYQCVLGFLFPNHRLPLHEYQSDVYSTASRSRSRSLSLSLSQTTFHQSERWSMVHTQAEFITYITLIYSMRMRVGGWDT